MDQSISLTSTFAPLVLFMAVQSITPGPNNLMLAMAGANAGFRATLPHMLGVSAGTAVQIVVLAAGLAPLLRAQPAFLLAFTAFSVGYLLWLAIRLWRSEPDATQPRGAGRPLSFGGAVLFQWINPKAWMMSLTVASVFWPPSAGFAEAALATAGVASAVNLPCIGLWAAAGVALRRWLTVGWRWRLFNGVMAAALLATAAGLLVDGPFR
jgi:threonine/homoserine/homoserine lactone efflux protein